jgi:hypothetical protein
LKGEWVINKDLSIQINGERGIILFSVETIHRAQEGADSLFDKSKVYDATTAESNFNYPNPMLSKDTAERVPYIKLTPTELQFVSTLTVDAF